MIETKTKMTDIELDSFTRAYLVCALWSSNDESTPQGGEPFDSNYGISDFAPEAIARAVADCAKFQTENIGLINEAELDLTRAGHCFWLNRNGHGSGFWDEYLSNDPRQVPCDKLSEASRDFGETDLYLGDDGKIHLS